MANAEAGSAYISIIPSMKGFDTKLSSGISDAVGKVGKVAAAAFAAVGAGAVAAGKMALDSYSDYEQLSGGMKALFGSAYGTVMQNASSAYEKMGMSANDYMRNVTGVSGALRHSIGGDSQEVARMANVAMQDIADNASVYGTDIGTITEGYMSLARGNYQMLDTVTQGYYAGTKTGLEQLIKDANEYERSQGRAGDLTVDSYADIVQAIHDYQEQMGVAGNATKEAYDTISGSMDMAKAAWQNWLTGLGDENVDMGKLTDQLLQAIEAVAQNVGPRVKIIGERIVAALPQMAQMVGQAAYSLLREAFVGAWNMVSDALSGINISMPKLDASGFDQGWEDLLATMRQLAPVVAGVAGALGALKVVDEVSSGVEALTAAIGKLVVVKQVGEGAEAAAGSVQLLVNPLGAVAIAAGAAVAVFGTLYATNEDFRNSVNSLASDVASTVQPAIDAAKGALQGIGDYLSATFGPAIQTAGQGLSEFAGNLGQTFAPVAEAASGALQGIADAVSGTLVPAFQTLATFVQPALTMIANVLASVLGPALQMVASIVSTVFATAFTVAGSIISGAMQVIGGVVQAVVGTIQTIIGVFVGLFTGDWSMAASGASSIMQGFSSAVLGIFNALTGTLGGILRGIASLFSNVFNGVAGVVGGIFGGVAKTMGSKIDGAKSVVKAGLSAISGFFKGLHLELPRIKLPHFSLSGDFDLAKGKVPHISVSWYAKGGIAQHLAVLGEAGAEAIVPYTNRNIMPWANALSAAMDEPEGGYGDPQADVLAELRSLHRDVANLRVYIDKRTLVGSIATDARAAQRMMA